MIKELFEKYFHVPRQQPGWPVLAVAGGLTAIVSALYLPLGLIGLAGLIYLKIILRMPKRPQPDIKAGQIAAPIDGQILMIHHDRENARYLVRVRPDWFNSHIAYAPIDGLIDQQIWYDGDFIAFGDAEMPGPSCVRQEIIFLPSGDASFGDASFGDASFGDRIAMTHYGEPFVRILQSCLPEGRQVNPSMAVALGVVRPKIDISFPDSYLVMVVPGKRCLAGETILADKS